MDWGAKIPLSQAGLDQLYIKLWALLGTASSSAVLVQEYTSAGAFVASSFKTIPAGAAWGEYIFTHQASAANVGYVVVRLCPACDGSGTASLTGTTNFADFRISKQPI
jgi:hypothetical protein